MGSLTHLWFSDHFETFFHLDSFYNHSCHILLWLAFNFLAVSPRILHFCQKQSGRGYVSFLAKSVVVYNQTLLCKICTSKHWTSFEIKEIIFAASFVKFHN